MNSSKFTENTNIQYCTYGEILRLALVWKYEHAETVPNDEEQLSFVDNLISDVNAAIEDREIIPIVLEKSESSVGDYNFYFNKFKTDYCWIFLIAFVLAIKYLWDIPAIRNDVLKHDPNVDIWGIVCNMLIIVVIAAMVPLITDIYKIVKIFILNLNRETSIGSIKYQFQEAKYRGYFDSAYYTHSVLGFLRSKYNFDINPEKDSKIFDDVIYAAVPNVPPKYLEGILNNPDISTGELSVVINKQRTAEKDKEISDKMKNLANVRHAPRRTAKEKIEKIINDEILPPCTCFHNQIARFIIKNDDKKESNISLSFIDNNGSKKKLSDNDVLEIAKMVMVKYDKARIYNKTLKINLCQKHRTR